VVGQQSPKSYGKLTDWRLAPRPQVSLATRYEDLRAQGGVAQGAQICPRRMVAQTGKIDCSARKLLDSSGLRHAQVAKPARSRRCTGRTQA